jgi:2',3'-cyclic-nucleotide 2'-phosphodiesterase (5'-nucleotidase family)
LLDSGDAVSAPNVLAWPWPELTIAMMNLAGYDAMAVGNREYCWYQRGLISKTRGAKFAVLSANLHPGRGQLGHLQRWTVLTSPTGVRVGVFGLTEVMVPPGSRWGKVAASRFSEPLSAAREAVTALQGRCEVMVALTHYGLGRESELAAVLPAGSAVLCGHWHVPEPSLEYHGQIAVARTFHHGSGASILHFDGSQWALEEVRF